MDLETYRQTEVELKRWKDLLRLLPKGQHSILDIGARDGFHSRILSEYYAAVTALDLEQPTFSAERVTTIKGDVTDLQFPANYFDCVLCAEVLEHVRAVEQAVAEIIRVAKKDVVIGVPYREDTRVGKLTCSSCGKVNPHYGHVNVFDEATLRALFHGLEIVEVSFVGQSKERTNHLSSFLMTTAGNPFGTYDQTEPCVFCGRHMLGPASRLPYQRVASRLASYLDSVQRILTRPSPNWIHIRFRKRDGAF